MVGLAGLLGSGRTELGRILSGVDRADAGTLTVARPDPALPVPAGCVEAAGGVLLGEPASRGHRRRPDHPRQHRAGAAVRPRMAPARSPEAAGRADRQLHRGTEHPSGQPRRAGPQPLRRQPAEGAAGSLARHRTAAADLGRAHPRHRRRCQGRDPEAGGRPGRQRDVGAVHLRRAGGGAAAEPPGRRCCAIDARSPTSRTTTSRVSDSWPSSPTAPQPRRSRHEPGDHSTGCSGPSSLLAVLFLVNLIAFPGFFRIEIKDGHLFGSLIDILRNGAPTLIVAVGHDSGDRHPRHRPVGRGRRRRSPARWPARSSWTRRSRDRSPPSRPRCWSSLAVAVRAGPVERCCWSPCSASSPSSPR